MTIHQRAVEYQEEKIMLAAVYRIEACLGAPLLVGFQGGGAAVAQAEHLAAAAVMLLFQRQVLAAVQDLELLLRQRMLLLQLHATATICSSE